MLGKLLCRIGWHSWRRTNGRGLSTRFSQMAIFFDQDCRRCGKHQEEVIVL